MVFSRKKDDILNDLHSAQGRLNFSEIMDLEKELDMLYVRWKLKQKTQNIIDSKEEWEIEELKKIINKSVKEEVKNYMEWMTGIQIDKKIIDNNLVALISVLHDILNTNPEKKDTIKEIITKYLQRIQ